MRVCIFGTFDARRHPRIAIIEEGLRSHGYDVVRCNEPWNAPTDLRVAALRRPQLLALLGIRLIAAWWRLIRQAHRVGRVDVVVVGYLGVIDVHLARLLWWRARLVLDHLAPIHGTVADRSGGGAWLRGLTAAVDRAAVRRAELVLVDTDEHRGRGERYVVVPVGASHAWFSAQRPTVAVKGPLRVVFFGLFTPLQGASVIAQAVRELLAKSEPIQVTMIGHGQDLQSCQRLLLGWRDVRWIDWVDSEALPSIVANHHICLGIFGDTPKARRVVPNKVYQGAAAGCAIVTAETSPQRRALSDAAIFVPAGDAQALAAVIRDLANSPSRVEALQRAARARASACFRPEMAVLPLIDRLGGQPSPR